MQWYFLAAGLSLLMTAVLLTYLFKHKQAPFAVPFSYRRLPFPGKLRGLLRKAASLQPTDASASYSDFRVLMEHVLRVGNELSSLPPLPAGRDGLLRMMPIAESLLDEAAFTPQALQDTLSHFPDRPLLPSETAYFPLCVEASQCSRLADVLSGLLRDTKERAAAPRLARRMKRSRHPIRLVERSGLHSAGMAELLTILRADHAAALLSQLEGWLEQKETSPDLISAQALERQFRFAEELRRAEECFSSLSRMNWLPFCEFVDPVHQLLTDDPAGIYPRMEIHARLDLRLMVENLARRLHMQVDELLHQAIRLSQEADEHSLEAYAGYWFQDASGMRALLKTLPGRKGMLYPLFALRRDARHYAGLLIFGILTGFLFLQWRHPVFMLPFFAWTAGCIIRSLLSRKKPAPLPRMELSGAPQELRTLVILPTVLTDLHEAIRQVRRMKVLRQTFSEVEADFLLLGDFSENMTAVSSSDAPIIRAATAAIATLEDNRCLYVQRGRTWNPDQHIYAARGGRRGAVTSICRLIAQGECEDVIAYANVEAASFERRYAYVLVLPDDRQPAPGMLEELLQVMTHPMCSRYPAPEGWRGYSVLSPEGMNMFEGVGLIRPDAYLEATDGLVYDGQDADALCGELAGHAAISGAALEAAATDASLETLYQTARRAWQLAPWQLPWVQTPSGLIHNPLKYLSRFRLREMLRETLVPLGQCVLLIWAVLTGSWPLLVLALAAPEVGHLPRQISGWLHMVCRLSLLPIRAILPLRAILDILRRKPTPPSFVPLEVWTQGIAATIMAALGIAFPGMALPALALGVLFACFPLAHKYDGAFVHASEGMTEEHTALLDHLAEGTWRFFRENTLEENHSLPPCSVQFEPPAGPEHATSPEAIASSLLACVCAKELELASANEAARYISRTLTSLGKLSMPFGLPCRRYALPSLTVLDARVDASGTGLLLAALMTTAQALRTWLPELDGEFLTLSAEAEKIADSFDLHALYDTEADLFHQQLDENGQGTGYVTCYTDEALLLSVAACARKRIPPQHFSHLIRTCVRLHSKEIPISRTGSASEHLLAGLFFPIREEDALASISAMQASGQHGLWGQSDCSCFSFDPSLRYKRASFGMQESALSSISTAPVYTPYAAALCLPFVPHAAGEALLRFHGLGASGPMGMCDAVDLTQGQAVVGLHDTLHQGIMFMCIAHMLADAPVQRYFCALPEVEACLPLLSKRGQPLILPVLPALKKTDKSAAVSDYAANPRIEPPETHLTGTSDLHILTNARGNSALYDRDIPLCRFDPASQAPQGIQFYLADEGRVYRVGDPHNMGEVIFSPGETRFEQICGSLKVELITVADTLRRRALHILTITNLSTRDRVIDAADCLLPDLGVPQNTLEVRRPEMHRLLLQSRQNGHALHHTLSCSVPPLALSVCTDAAAFLGRNRTLHAPASLEEAAFDLLTASAEPCLSFRVRMTLGGRGQAMLWFTTSMQEHEPPQLAALPGIRRLAGLQHEAIDASIPMSDVQRGFLRRLLPLLVQSECRLAVHKASTEREQDIITLAAALDWLQLHGLKAEAWIMCPSECLPIVQELLKGHACEDLITLTEDAPPASWTNALFLQGNAEFSTQLEALYAHLPLEASYMPPRPALLPKAELEHRSSYGGFDPETGDYIIELEPGMTTPAPWENTHVSRGFRETVDESGLRMPFGEQVWITLPDGTALSPWSPELARSIRMSPGMTSWEAWSEQLDLRLSAACMPAHRCGVRVLRLRNATDAPLEIRLTVHASLGNSMLDCAQGVVMGSPDGHGLCAYLAGNGWTAQRSMPHPLAAPDAPPMDMPDQPHGHFALLSITLTLPAQGSGEACWLAGYARHAEDTARALDALRHNGKSDLLRSVQSIWAQHLNTLTISTPEDTLDLLINSILPRQALSIDGVASVPALLYLVPEKAKWHLLKKARHTHERDAWAELTLLISRYIQVTKDTSILDVWLTQHEKSILSACTEALMTLPVDHRGLPLGDDAERRCLLFAMAAQALNHCAADPELAEFSRKLLNAADTYLWADICYGTPLRLDVQALSCMAYGSNPRTRQAMRTTWMTLYDPFHGLIRRQEPDEAPPLPGLPENGGMLTTDTVLALHALLKTAHSPEAHELLRALNPIHHSDDSQRMETFRGAPYRLHGGMCATPLEAGRATTEGGDEAAAMLYAVVLEDVLGLHREGNTLRILPHVPSEWDDYALTLREGASTWHINVERHIKALTIDGEETREDAIHLHDDGRIHQVRVPLR